MKKLPRVLSTLLLVGVVFLCGCEQKGLGQATTLQRPQELKPTNGNDQRGYLSVVTGRILFVRWTEVNKKLNGQLQVFYAEGNRDWRTDTSAHSFEGVSDGENISINFTGSVWFERLSGKTWTGTLKDKELKLVVPTRSGVLETITLESATVDDYNQAVLSLKRNVTETNAQMQKERAETAKKAAEQRAVTVGNEGVENSIRRSANAANVLEEKTRFDDVLSAYAREMEKMKAHYQEMKNLAAKQPLDSYQFGKVEYALGKMEYDLSSVQYRNGSMEYRMEQVKTAISDAKEEINGLQGAWTKLQNAVASNSVGTPGAKFTQNDVLQSINATESRISKALALMQSASKQAASYETQAKKLYKDGEAFVKGLKNAER